MSSQGSSKRKRTSKGSGGESSAGASGKGQVPPGDSQSQEIVRLTLELTRTKRELARTKPITHVYDGQAADDPVFEELANELGSKTVVVAQLNEKVESLEEELQWEKAVNLSLKDQQKQVEDALNLELKCSICLGMMVKAVCLPCGHSFCHHCISSHLVKRRPATPACPLCSRECDPTAPLAPIFAIRLLQAKLLSCISAAGQAEYGGDR